jgi:hypothetical protein
VSCAVRLCVASFCLSGSTYNSHRITLNIGALAAERQSNHWLTAVLPAGSQQVCATQQGIPHRTESAALRLLPPSRPCSRGPSYAYNQWVPPTDTCVLVLPLSWYLNHLTFLSNTPQGAFCCTHRHYMCPRRNQSHVYVRGIPPCMPLQCHCHCCCRP